MLSFCVYFINFSARYVHDCLVHWTWPEERGIGMVHRYIAEALGDTVGQN